MIDRALEALFLRLYARNLRRSYRSEPANACSDSEIQLSIMLAVGIGTVFLIVGSILFPGYLRKMVNGGDLMCGAIIAVTVGIVFGVRRRFGDYEKKPEAALKFNSKQNHQWSQLAIGQFSHVRLHHRNVVS
jgi:hypothetical protein